ncbi:hypothetical protein [Oceanospirillum beijerinckii]|uniref:hypothetical protein n=1 Tax=Oceanospirillum beijerinckii TaxID=64976 RepID=UPI0003FABB5C|nr:hypothetical protein [Oceanospirillum beijerinckii]
MKNNRHLLEKSIESLKMIQLEMHDVMDSSKRDELDKIILDLEQYGDQKTSSQLLDLLGKCLSLVPTVEKLLRMLSEF